MVGHLVIAPVLLPMFAAALIVALGDQRRPSACRAVSLANCMALVLASIWLLVWAVSNEPAVYVLGNWQAPYGIVLVLDRLSALMVALTSLLSVATCWYALRGWDTRGRHFHALLQLQLMGLNGAFLTGDLFNLFVFFELLLIASYGLMLHGGGVARQRATLHYIVYNLVASTLFLFAAGLLYGVTGTLNMADLSLQVAAAPIEDATLIRSAGMLLLVVFAIKAAVLPLCFWLQEGYRTASPPVACLFAVMTKVGLYSILRVCTLIFGSDAGAGADLAAAWLLPAGIATLAFSTVGVIASRSFGMLVTYLVIASAGSMLVGVGTFSEGGIAAALFYLVHSTLVVALLFLLAGEIARERGALGSDLLPGPALAAPVRLGVVFLFAGVAASGLPPVSGFIAKIGILQGVQDSPWAYSAWVAILVSSLLTVIALARAGSMLFWRAGAGAGVSASVDGVPATAMVPLATVPAASFGPVWLLVVALIALTAGARPVQSYLDATGMQLMSPANYVDAVIRPVQSDGNEEINVDGDRLRAGQPPAGTTSAQQSAYRTAL